MAITAQLEDGTRLEFPDGTDAAVIQSTVKNVIAGRAANKPAAVQAGESLRDIPRQVGLTARYGLEGLGSVLDVGAEPIRNLIVNPAMRAVGARPAESSVSQLASKLSDSIGLPSPQGANERVIGDATRMLAGSAGMAAGAGRAAATAAPGVTRNVLQMLGANPGSQAAGAVGAGLAGGATREAGGGPLEQFGASLLGGVAGGVGVSALGSAAQGAANKVRQAVTPAAVELQRADQQISLTLSRAGIDWSQVPERIKQGMRQEVADALNTGQPLNADAMRRLLVFRRAEVTPTVGQLTQDPGLITREQNLAKTGANSTSPALQRLPRLQNENVASLLRQLDDARPLPQDGAAMRAGSAAVNSLDSTVAREQANIDRLYSAARDTSGRSLPLEGGTFTRRASELLDQAMAGGALPKDVQNRLNAIAAGEYPLTVESAEDLKRVIGRLQRSSSDGTARHALGLVRQALDDTPLQNAKTWNPENLPAMPGAVPPSTAAAGEQSIAAFNEARSANRAWMQRIEGNPALRAVVDGVEPDKFVERFVVGGQATAADVRALQSELDQRAISELRGYLIRHLKDKATGGAEDVVTFGGKSYRDALKAIENKLPVFFSEEEIQKLRDLGNAAKYMQAQPAGSAVNNSNSGALLIGRGLDMLEAAAQKIPVGKDAITGVIQGMQQRQVMAPKNALVLPAPVVKGQRANALVPTAALAAATAGKGRDDDRRN